MNKLIYILIFLAYSNAFYYSCHQEIPDPSPKEFSGIVTKKLKIL